MKKIKIHYFKVESYGAKTEPLETLLGKLAAVDISDRTKNCNYIDVRLDHLTPPTADKAYWLLRFSRFRNDNWPAVATLEEAAKDLELDEDEILSEETSMLYAPASQRAVIQYNHFGVRASKIQEYLLQSGAYGEGGHSLLPVLSSDALDKYADKKIVTAIDVVIDDVSATDIAYFGGSGLQGAINQAVDGTARRMRVTFSVDARERKNQLDKGTVQKMVDKVLGRNGDNDKLVVSAKADEDDAVEELNLLESKKCVEYNADSIPRTQGRRYSPDHMFALLEQAYREWEK
ncbi:DUF6731 family protein [Cupriavidus malaysiensis]|uniref:DUF6731 family protein n=1 Tax=Cupriavidus malaysiensis TaxID=367825 RepID=UPI0012FFA44B|nr:DUF6731 family protein [Cupriavidus malaysiensis]